MIRIISLISTPERRQRFHDANSGVAYEFFDAIDGSAIDVGTACQFKDVRYTPGAMGCALSHVALWREASSGSTCMTIAEDDAIMRADFDPVSARVMRDAPAEWDVIMWAWNFDSVLSLNVLLGVSPVVLICNQDQMRENIPRFRAMQAFPSLLRLDKCFGLPCYSVSPTGAAKLLQLCWPPRAKAIYVPGLKNNWILNDGIDKLAMAAYPQINAFVALPPLAVTPNRNEKSLTRSHDLTAPRSSIGNDRGLASPPGRTA
jgi:glycosyl transferase, family 25